MRWTWLWLLLVLSPLAGCNCGPAGVDTLPFPCTQDSECEQPDWLCRRGECVRADAGCAAALELCDDGLENDCDELIDCEDPDCDTAACGTGGTCSDSACVCPGVDAPEPMEATCADGQDNDCDGLTDCEDASSCSGSACGPEGRVCDTSGGCVCSGNGGEVQPGAETTCDDGADNDCDGLVDCADSDCAQQRCGPSSVCCFTSEGGCRDLSRSELHCGGCGIACDTTAQDEVCQAFPTATGDSGRCTCDTPAECTLGQTCGLDGTCQCATEANCQPGQVCDDGTCRYP